MPLITDTIQITADQLRDLDVGRIRCNEPLKCHSTWRIGGNAAMLVQPENIKQLSNLMSMVHCNGLNYITVGDGSNLLFSDVGVDGVVVKLGCSFSQCRIQGDIIVAQAGIAVPRLARLAGLAGLSGLEHTVGIPGTLGGLVAMNGGSLGGSIGDVVETVRCVDAAGTMFEFEKDACIFSYRDSIFLSSNFTVVEVTLRLLPKEPKQILSEMLDILRDRRRKFPRRLPNCGSVFKRNEDLFRRYGPPGKVIEDFGFKGYSVGDAQVSAKHANFIVNNGNAGADDVLELIQTIRACVHDKTGIWMDCEVRHVDLNGNVQPAHLIVAE